MREHGPWKVRSTREVHRDPWLALTVDDVVRPDGTAGTFSVVRIIPGVCVLALDDQEFVHLAEEFRYAAGRMSLEAVGGGVDAGEDAAAAAKRELKEELGIEAAEWADLGVVNRQPGVPLRGQAELVRLHRDTRSPLSAARLMDPFKE